MNRAHQLSWLALLTGLVLQIVMGWLYLVGGLIYPYVAYIWLGVAWVIGLVVIIKFRYRPALVVGVPIVMLVIWLATVWLTPGSEWHV